MMNYRIGIDLGGTKIECIVLDENTVVHRKRIATPKGHYEKTLQAICDLVKEAEQFVGQPCTVGIGTPGAISQKTGFLKNSNSVCLNGKPVKQDLEKRLNREIRISNDANCFALSEASDGAAAGANIVFGVIIGTGTGAGIVANQQILEGANKISGEWGHNPMPWPKPSELPGPDCYCGQQGCIETFLSGPGLEADYYHHYNTKLGSQQIVLQATQGDERCEAVLQRYEDRLARALSHVINILDPEVIVLGGGLSNISRLYENIPTLWQQYVFSDQVLTQLKPPMHGDASGVRGAARLWPIQALTNARRHMKP